MTELEVGKKYWIKAEYKKLNELNDFQHWFKVGSFDELVMLDDLKEVREVLPEREKVTIPKEVADWIEHCKDGMYRLSVSLEQGIDNGSKELSTWLFNRSNQDTFARAWLDGYEIEEEPLYWVRDNKGKSILYKDVMAGGKVTRSGGSNVSHQERHSVEYTFTEKEIKAYDERFWAFRVEVTDD